MNIICEKCLGKSKNVINMENGVLVCEHCYDDLMRIFLRSMGE